MNKSIGPIRESQISDVPSSFTVIFLHRAGRKVQGKEAGHRGKCKERKLKGIKTEHTWKLKRE